MLWLFAPLPLAVPDRIMGGENASIIGREGRQQHDKNSSIIDVLVAMIAAVEVLALKRRPILLLVVDSFV